MSLRSPRRRNPRVDVIPLIDVLMVLILFLGVLHRMTIRVLNLTIHDKV